ncbi:MAG: CAP domain-containing protein [Chloroflexota bacterium]
MRRPKLLLATLLIASFSLGALPGAASASFCGKSSHAPAELTGHQLRTSVLCLVNAARERHGLARLHFKVPLRKAATGHSLSMVRSRLFSHYGPGGSSVTTRVAHTGYLFHASSYRLAENIAAGEGRKYGSPLGIVRLWMHSPPHRANILDPSLRDFGVGIARGDAFAGTSKGVTYTLDFGARG